MVGLFVVVVAAADTFPLIVVVVVGMKELSDNLIEIVAKTNVVVAAGQIVVV